MDGLFNLNKPIVILTLLVCLTQTLFVVTDHVIIVAEDETSGIMQFGVNYFSTHNHYEPFYLTDEVLNRDFGFFQSRGLKYVTLCAIWKYLEPELGVYNEEAIDDIARVCSVASQYNLKVNINFYTMMGEGSLKMPEWLSPRKFETVFLNETAHQAWLDFLDHCASRLNNEEIWSWHMMNEPYRREWACDVSIDDFIQLWTEMKAVFKSYSDRPVSVRFAANSIEPSYHFNNDPRLYTLFDYLAVNYYEEFCPPENFTRIISTAQQNNCPVIVTEFGSETDDDAAQTSEYQEILTLFRNLGITDCIAWMWRADYNSDNPEPPGIGFNLAKYTDGTPRPAFNLLTNPTPPSPSPSASTSPSPTPTAAPTPSSSPLPSISIQPSSTPTATPKPTPTSAATPSPSPTSTSSEEVVGSDIPFLFFLSAGTIAVGIAYLLTKKR